MIRLVRYLRSNRFTGSLLSAMRPTYRALRGRWLRLRHPRGGFITATGVSVYCDFSKPDYAWYDADSPNLSFDCRVITGLLDQVQGSVFVDVGAHYGFYAAFLADELSRRGRRAKVIALEPDPDNFRCLQQTMLRPRAGVETKLFRIALGDRDVEINLYRSPEAACAHTYEDARSSIAGTSTMRRLDTLRRDLLANGDRIAFVKVDIDGAEASFMRGAERTIAADGPILFMEFGPSGLRSANTDPQRFFEALCEQFHVYWIASEIGIVRHVRPGDYGEMIERVGNRVTDLVLSRQQIGFQVFR